MGRRRVGRDQQVYCVDVCIGTVCHAVDWGKVEKDAAEYVESGVMFEGEEGE